jgi:hypothetical protein
MRPLCTFQRREDQFGCSRCKRRYRVEPFDPQFPLERNEIRRIPYYLNTGRCRSSLAIQSPEVSRDAFQGRIKGGLHEAKFLHKFVGRAAGFCLTAGGLIGEGRRPATHFLPMPILPIPYRDQRSRAYCPSNKIFANGSNGQLRLPRNDQAPGLRRHSYRSDIARYGRRTMGDCLA